MTASPALLTKELESAMAKLRLIAREGGGMCFALMTDAEATALLQHIAALEQRVSELDAACTDLASPDFMLSFRAKQERDAVLAQRGEAARAQIVRQCRDWLREYAHSYVEKWTGLAPVAENYHKAVAWNIEAAAARMEEALALPKEPT